MERQLFLNFVSYDTRVMWFISINGSSSISLWNYVYCTERFVCFAKCVTWISLFFFLSQALCGMIIESPLLTGEKIKLDLRGEVIKPTMAKRIQGHGLPFPKDSGRRGDLIVNFDIKFPEHLTESTKKIIQGCLPDV